MILDAQKTVSQKCKVNVIKVFSLKYDNSLQHKYRQVLPEVNKLRLCPSAHVFFRFLGVLMAAKSHPSVLLTIPMINCRCWIVVF